jgi:hypothetical protein
LRQWESACIIQRSAGIDSEESNLRLALTASPADSTYEVSVPQVSQALRSIHGVVEGSFTVTPFYPERYIILCRSQAVRDSILAATPVPVAGARLNIRPWTRLAHADASTFKFKVALELEGIPPHVWTEDTVAKILAPACWVEAVHPATITKSDLSTFKLNAWTCDPRAIPKVVWLHVAENEVVGVHAAANPIFNNLPPYLRFKHVLGYRVLVHIRCITDFDPENPTPPPSPPESDDGDSGHDGNPDRHHFSSGTRP